MCLYIYIYIYIQVAVINVHSYVVVCRTERYGNFYWTFWRSRTKLLNWASPMNLYTRLFHIELNLHNSALVRSDRIVPFLMCLHTSRRQDQMSRRKALHRWQNAPQSSWQINRCSVNLHSSCKVTWSSQRRSQSSCVWSGLATHIHTFQIMSRADRYMAENNQMTTLMIMVWLFLCGDRNITG